MRTGAYWSDLAPQVKQMAKTSAGKSIPNDRPAVSSTHNAQTPTASTCLISMGVSYYPDRHRLQGQEEFSNVLLQIKERKATILVSRAGFWDLLL